MGQTSRTFGLHSAFKLTKRDRVHPHHRIHRHVEIFYTPHIFVLCVDDFGVKYYLRNDAEHLFNTLGILYEYTVDWAGASFCRLTLNWN